MLRRALNWAPIKLRETLDLSDSCTRGRRFSCSPPLVEVKKIWIFFVGKNVDFEFENFLEISWRQLSRCYPVEEPPWTSRYHIAAMCYGWRVALGGLMMRTGFSISVRLLACINSQSGKIVLNAAHVDATLRDISVLKCPKRCDAFISYDLVLSWGISVSSTVPKDVNPLLHGLM